MDKRERLLYRVDVQAYLTLLVTQALLQVLSCAGSIIQTVLNHSVLLPMTVLRRCFAHEL